MGLRNGVRPIGGGEALVMTMTIDVDDLVAVRWWKRDMRTRRATDVHDLWEAAAVTGEKVCSSPFLSDNASSNRLTGVQEAEEITPTPNPPSPLPVANAENLWEKKPL